MHRYLFCSLLAIWFISCGGMRNTSTTPENRVSQYLPAEADSLSGEWIRTGYLDRIAGLNSIWAAGGPGEGMLGFLLDKEELLTGTAELNGFDTHEGGYTCRIRWKETIGAFVCDTNAHEVVAFSDYFELQRKGRLLEMVFPKKGTADRYRRMDADLQTELRRMLVEGEYREAKNDSIIHLGRDGSVSGFMNHHYCELVYDFGLGIDYDAIVFYPTQEGGNLSQGTLYTWGREGKNLCLRKVNTDWENLEHTISRQEYILARVN